MKETDGSGRANQKLRTRAALLDAAAALIGQGRKPAVPEVAEAALVSRATAYRYFPNADDLLNEAALHAGMLSADREVRQAFEGLIDPEERVDRAERGIHEFVYDNEIQSRLLLRASLDSWFSGKGEDDGLPRRQARRKEWFGAALAPIREELGGRLYENLCSALSMLTGVESLIVLKDILHLDRRRARKVKSWAVRALVREALRQSSRRPGSGRHRLRRDRP